ncbi:MAG TPA: hypothetical protein VFC01_25345 [Mycobacterium sp.]|nr:hypothetical protein [Mycobacterium sp.]
MNAELAEELVTMAEKGRAVRAALSSEDPANIAKLRASKARRTQSYPPDHP